MPLARPFALACSAVLLLAAFSAAAQTSRTNTPAPPAPAKTTSAKPAPPAPTGTFEDFKGIPDRNIFNTRRLAGRSSAEPAPVVAPRRERVIESFSLLGTMQYEKGRLAFFEGSSPSHKKSVQVDEAIAGCKITAIEPSAITLEANGKPLELRVGFMLRREDDGAWETRVAERPSDYGSSSSYSSSSPFGGSSSSSSPFGSSSFGRDSRSSSSSSRFGGGSSPTEYAQTRLREQDRNNDGKISRDEADSRLRDRFREIDRNSDGFVDGEEYLAYYVARMGGGSTSSSSSSRSPFSSAPSSSPPFGNSSSSSAPPPSSSSPSSGGAGESELLRRLMEQRARENR